MTKDGKRIWTAVVVVLALMGFLTSCAGPLRPERRPVRIQGPIQSLTFNPDTVPARPGDFILWPNTFDVTVSVELRDAPMRPTWQRIPAGGEGKIQVIPSARPGLYKYNVVVTSGRDTLVVVDPYVDVQPKK